MIPKSIKEDRQILVSTVLMAAFSDIRYMSDTGRRNFRRFHDLAAQPAPDKAAFIEAFWRLPKVWQLILEPMLPQYGCRNIGQIQ